MPAGYELWVAQHKAKFPGGMSITDATGYSLPLTLSIEVRVCLAVQQRT